MYFFGFILSAQLTVEKNKLLAVTQLTRPDPGDCLEFGYA
jgi:hypothetical protein